MGLGHFAEAAECFRRSTSDMSPMEIGNVFNYGMARWGMAGTIETGIFERVIALDESSEGNEETANYLQCMAIAYWATGETDKAADRADRAERLLATLRKGSEFSSWRYLVVSAGVFKMDLDEIRTMIQEIEPRTLPRFMRPPGAAGSDP